MSTLPLAASGLFTPFASVARAWRGIERRHVAYALLAGAAVGTVQGLGAALWVTAAWWRGFILMFVPTVLQALLLLVVLVAAAQVRPERVPRWLPFVTAGILATVAIGIFDQVALGPMLSDPTRPASNAPWYTIVWFNLPSSLLIGVLASLAYMHLVHESQSTRALSAIRIARTRAARAAYEERLLALRARVDPAFLFGTLRRVDRLYDEDPARGERLLDHLITFLRAALPTLETPSSTVAKELSLLRAWLDIMRMQHGDRLTFRIGIDENAAGAAMPAMVLLPLVAGTVVDGEPPWGCNVNVSMPGERLRFDVRVEGQDAAHAALERASDLVLERLRALYGAHASLSTTRTAAQRSQAIVEIPLEHADRDHR